MPHIIRKSCSKQGAHVLYEKECIDWSFCSLQQRDSPAVKLLRGGEVGAPAKGDAAEIGEPVNDVRELLALLPTTWVFFSPTCFKGCPDHEKKSTSICKTVDTGLQLYNTQDEKTKHLRGTQRTFLLQLSPSNVSTSILSQTIEFLSGW